MAETNTVTDERYVYGALCTWHGPISEVGTSGGFPVCPHCGGVLYEVDSQAKWDTMVKTLAENRNEPLYPDWIKTLHDSGTCKPVMDFDWEKELNDYKAARA